jgi:hypothetical protein
MALELDRSPKPSTIVFLAAVLCAASMWFYVQRVLIPYEIKDAAAHQRPRGNLSDLYPRWLGARELFLHRRNPYSDDITKEIQQGYYGRALDPARPNDPKDEQRFAYPVYVVFFLAPFIHLPFPIVRVVFQWLLAALTAASVCLWLRALSWRLRPYEIAAFIALTLGSFPAVQGIKLGQLSLLVAALLAAAAACLTSGLLFYAGILLACATIKPQLTWPLAVWLLVWTIREWKSRRKLVLGFALTLALLLAGAQIILPGWWVLFASGMREYHRYTQNQSVLEVLLPGALTGKIVAVVAVVACALTLAQARLTTAGKDQFDRAAALVMALTILVVPMCAPYNQVCLAPAVMVLVRDRSFFVSRSRGLRFAYVAGACALFWPWIASLGADFAYLFGSEKLALRGWWWPGMATFVFPVLVFVLMFLDVRAFRLGSLSTPQEKSAE